MKKILFIVLLFVLHSTVYCMNDDVTLNFKSIIQEAKDREFQKASIQISFFDALFNHELVIENNNVTFGDYQKKVTFHGYEKKYVLYNYSLEEVSKMIIQMVTQIKNSSIEQKITESHIERSVAFTGLTKLDIARIQFYRFKQFIGYCPDIYEEVVKNLHNCIEDPDELLKFTQSMNLMGKSKKQVKKFLSRICAKHTLIISGLITQDISLIHKAYAMSISLPKQTIGEYLDKVF